MEIDTLGTFQMSRAAHPHLKRRGGGVVVNISATLHYGATFYQVGRSGQKALRAKALATESVQDEACGGRLGERCTGLVRRDAGTGGRPLNSLSTA
jgi:2,4-dienoyl-CoA reductase [(3E)-enoyl-CoA-producing], peroxisomal